MFPERDDKRLSESDKCSNIVDLNPSATSLPLDVVFETVALEFEEVVGVDVKLSIDVSLF